MREILIEVEYVASINLVQMVRELKLKWRGVDDAILNIDSSYVMRVRVT